MSLGVAILIGACTSPPPDGMDSVPEDAISSQVRHDSSFRQDSRNDGSRPPDVEEPAVGRSPSPLSCDGPSNGLPLSTVAAALAPASPMAPPDAAFVVTWSTVDRSGDSTLAVRHLDTSGAWLDGGFTIQFGRYTPNDVDIVPIDSGYGLVLDIDGVAHHSSVVALQVGEALTGHAPVHTLASDATEDRVNPYHGVGVASRGETIWVTFAAPARGPGRGVFAASLSRTGEFVEVDPFRVDRPGTGVGSHPDVVVGPDSAYVGFVASEPATLHVVELNERSPTTREQRRIGGAVWSKSVDSLRLASLGSALHAWYLHVDGGTPDAPNRLLHWRSTPEESGLAGRESVTFRRAPEGLDYVPIPPEVSGRTPRVRATWRIDSESTFRTGILDPPAPTTGGVRTLEVDDDLPADITVDLASNDGRAASVLGGRTICIAG